jgi:lipopolysaccharide assembly outer membrane protein LptD (OstA)
MKRVLLALCFASLCSAQSGVWNITAAQQTAEGHIYHLRGNAQISNADLLFSADRIDYDEERAVIHLAGHVTIESKRAHLLALDPATGKLIREVPMALQGTLRADEADYDVKSGDLTMKAKLLPAR